MSETSCFFRLSLTSQIELHVAVWTHQILLMLEIFYYLIKIIRHTFFAGGLECQWLSNDSSIIATITLSSVRAISDSYQLKILEPQKHLSLSLRRTVFLNSKNLSWYPGNLQSCWTITLQWSARYSFSRCVIVSDHKNFCGKLAVITDTEWESIEINHKVCRLDSCASNHILSTHGKVFLYAIERTI